MKKIISKGFTLIELLVVVAIIAIIASLLIVSISASRAKSRDARRIADLSSIQLALETYRDGKGFYPTTKEAVGATNYWIRSNNSNAASGSDNTADIIGNTPWDGTTTSLQSNLSNYLQVLPKDPIEGRTYSDSSTNPATNRNFTYEYGATTANYKLTAHLEQNDNAMTEDNGEYPYLYEIFTPGAKTWFSSPMIP